MDTNDTTKNIYNNDEIFSDSNEEQNNNYLDDDIINLANKAADNADRAAERIFNKGSQVYIYNHLTYIYILLLLFFFFFFF